MLTNSLLTSSLITHCALKRRNSKSADYTRGPVNIQAILFPGDIGEIMFQVQHGEGLNTFIMVDGRIRPHDPIKTMALHTTPMVKDCVVH